MVTYPLDFPAVGVTDSSFRLKRVVSESTSVFTGASQFYKHQGEWWEGEVTFRVMRRADAALVQSFLAKLRGKYGTFLYGDPDALALGKLGVGGTITVNGAGQTGNTLTVDGMTTSTNGILKAGDYFQIGTGSSARLYMATENLDSNGSGQGTLTFEPKLKESPADNASIISTAPKGVFRLSENTSEWRAGATNLYEITIAFKEAVNIAATDDVVFAPTDISGLKLWVDASDTATLWADTAGTTPATSGVGRWSDKSGMGNHLTQSSATSRPTTGTRTVNSLNALDFDGSDDYIDAPSSLYSITTNSNTFFFVCARDSSSGRMSYLRSSNFCELYSDSSLKLTAAHDTIFAYTTVAGSPDTNTHVAGFIRNGASVQSFKDGPLATATTAANVTVSKIRFGAEDASTFLFNGRILEILWYNRALSTSEINQIGNYLERWGTTWTDQ